MARCEHAGVSSLSTPGRPLSCVCGAVGGSRGGPGLWDELGGTALLPARCRSSPSLPGQLLRVFLKRWLADLPGSAQAVPGRPGLRMRGAGVRGCRVRVAAHRAGEDGVRSPLSGAAHCWVVAPAAWSDVPLPKAERVVSEDVACCPTRSQKWATAATATVAHGHKGVCHPQGVLDKPQTGARGAFYTEPQLVCGSLCVGVLERPGLEPQGHTSPLAS